MKQLNKLHDLGYRFTVDNSEIQFCVGVKKIGNNWTWFRDAILENAIQDALEWAITVPDRCSECGREK